MALQNTPAEMSRDFEKAADLYLGGLFEKINSALRPAAQVRRSSALGWAWQLLFLDLLKVAALPADSIARSETAASRAAGCTYVQLEHEGCSPSHLCTFMPRF